MKIGAHGNRGASVLRHIGLSQNPLLHLPQQAAPIKLAIRDLIFTAPYTETCSVSNSSTKCTMVP